MTPKLATTFFVVGTLLAPAAAWAAGTSDTRAGTSSSATAPSSATSHDAARAGATASGTESVKESVEDAAITTKVKSAFATDSQVSAMNIHVDTDRGVVRLSGNAKNRAEADKAVRIARDTKGVVSVTNDITVGGAAADTPATSSNDASMSKNSSGKATATSQGSKAKY